MDSQEREMCMQNKLDRRAVSIGTYKELEKEDILILEQASASEKFRAITYLRECFYGPEATTGRLQRIYTVFKR